MDVWMVITMIMMVLVISLVLGITGGLIHLAS